MVKTNFIASITLGMIVTSTLAAPTDYDDIIEARGFEEEPSLEARRYDVFRLSWKPDAPENRRIRQRANAVASHDHKAGQLRTRMFKAAGKAITSNAPGLALDQAMNAVDQHSRTSPAPNMNLPKHAPGQAKDKQHAALKQMHQQSKDIKQSLSEEQKKSAELRAKMKKRSMILHAANAFKSKGGKSNHRREYMDMYERGFDENLDARDFDEDLYARYFDEDIEERDFDEDLYARNFNEDLEARDSDEDIYARYFDEDLDARDFDEDPEARGYWDLELDGLY
ncbi:hypothetical protein AMATHDRAFT_50574 [Amanita thiersii Skay4041]|uniref:CCD97-like C-terminal domain-containing protein n=1 Tax=Amanita thiersii Skay4041 TaxID=703135 RepID=A0A2A9NH90_9AGAR|nr:hypothetical protein AMATHDRAFT_50574 [Amanita thiersii Skay4041]